MKNNSRGVVIWPTMERIFKVLKGQWLEFYMRV
jgi:hypothetical protein